MCRTCFRTFWLLNLNFNFLRIFTFVLKHCYSFSVYIHAEERFLRALVGWFSGWDFEISRENRPDHCWWSSSTQHCNPPPALHCYQLRNIAQVCPPRFFNNGLCVAVKWLGTSCTRHENPGRRKNFPLSCSRQWRGKECRINSSFYLLKS